MRIKKHKIPVRKGLLTAASAAFAVLAISALGRIVLRTDAAHSQTGAPAKAKPVQIAQNGPTILAPGNSGIVTQGQTGGTNIIVPKLPSREIDDKFRDTIRTHFPDKTKPMATAVLIGDDEDERIHLAKEIEDFLKSDGYTVEPRTYFLNPNGPIHGIQIIYDSNPIQIRIGVNVGDAP